VQYCAEIATKSSKLVGNIHILTISTFDQKWESVSEHTFFWQVSDWFAKAFLEILQRRLRSDSKLTNPERCLFSRNATKLHKCVRNRDILKISIFDTNEWLSRSIIFLIRLIFFAKTFLEILHSSLLSDSHFHKSPNVHYCAETATKSPKFTDNVHVLTISKFDQKWVTVSEHIFFD